MSREKRSGLGAMMVGAGTVLALVVIAVLFWGWNVYLGPGPTARSGDSTPAVPGRPGRSLSAATAGAERAAPVSAMATAVVTILRSMVPLVVVISLRP